MPSRNAIEIVISAQDDASEVLGSTDSMLGKIGKTAAIGAAAVVGATVAIGGGLLAMAKDAAPVEGIKNAFDSLAASAGKNADELVRQMQKQSMGLVDDTDLMLQYNKASQLVGATLAGQLPDAYQYVAKVASATGQDTGQLMDILVNGIGRVTPRMLTQLGVTVDADKANEAYAKSIGKTVEQLSKNDKQAALFNATMDALKKNTAGMPDITDNAATKMQQFKVKFDDISETLGLALLPMLSVFMDLLSKLTDLVLPILVPIVEQIGKGFQAFFQAISDGVNPLMAIGMAISALFGGTNTQVNGFLNNAKQGIDQFAAVASQFFNQIVQWVTGTALPALQRLGAWFIQDVLPAVVGFITGTVIPAVQRFIQIVSSIWASVQPVLATLVDWFINTGLPLAVNFIRDVVLVYVQKLIDGILVIWEKVQPGLQKLLDWFVSTGFPLITDFIQNIAMPIISKIIQVIGDIWTTVAPALGDLANWFLEDALPSVLDFITNTALPVIQSIINILKAIWTAVQPALHDFQNGITNVMNQIKIVVQPVIDFINDIINKFHDLQNLISGGVGALGGAAENASTAAGLVASGQVSPQQFLSALGNAISSQLSGHALGIANIPQDGMYKLHAGERVVPAAENQYGSNGNQIAINFYGGQGVQNQADANDAGFMIVGALKQNGVNV